jgi:hypothetical protein
MSRQEGSKIWVIPDGDLPPPGDGDFPGHESLIILNTGSREAEIEMRIFFEDRQPVKGISLSVAAERVKCFRLDKPVGREGYKIPAGQYALRLESTEPVFVQFGRADVRQPNLAYYCAMGIAAG